MLLLPRPRGRLIGKCRTLLLFSIQQFSIAANMFGALVFGQVEASFEIRKRGTVYRRTQNYLGGLNLLRDYLSSISIGARCAGISHRACAQCGRARVDEFAY